MLICFQGFKLKSGESHFFVSFYFLKEFFILVSSGVSCRLVHFFKHNHTLETFLFLTDGYGNASSNQ